MTTDTTLFEIFSDLGVLEVTQTEEGLEFITEECEGAWDNHLVAA
ncbi:MAG TPA: hypothetical protein V6C76_12330 [Drouetiella sp.]